MRKNCLGLMITAAFCAAWLAIPLAAQDMEASSPQEPSVADAARRAREQKKTEPAAKQVWTNDNIPQAPREVPAEAKAAAEGGAAEEGAAGAKATDEVKKSAELEAQWRQKFADARKKLDDDQKDLELMERELGLKRQQYYSDPNTAMRDQYQRDSGSGGAVNDLVKKIDDQKKKIDADKQAIDNLEEQLRKAGLPSGWSR
jgi:hypothetical protein